MVNQINIHAEATGVSAAVNGGNIDLTAADGRNINLNVDQGGAAATGTNAQGFTDANSARGTVTLTSESNITISDGAEELGFAAAGTANASIVVDTNNLNTSVDLTSRSGSLAAIDRIDSAMEKVLVFAVAWVQCRIVWK